MSSTLVESKNVFELHGVKTDVCLVVVLLDKSGFFCRKKGGHFFNTPLPTDDFFVLFFSNQNLLEPRGEDAPPLPPKKNSITR